MYINFPSIRSRKDIFGKSQIVTYLFANTDWNVFLPIKLLFVISTEKLYFLTSKKVALKISCTLSLLLQ